MTTPGAVDEIRRAAWSGTTRPRRRTADGDQEHHALAGGVGREERRDVVVEEGEAGGPEAEGVGRQIELAALDGRGQLRGPVTPLAEVGEDRLQLDQPEDVD